MNISFDSIKVFLRKVKTIVQSFDSLADNNSINGDLESQLTSNFDSNIISNKSMAKSKQQKSANGSGDKKINNVKRQLMTSADVLSCIKELCQSAIEAVQYCELQETEREQIRSIPDQNIEIIRSQRELIMHYLDRSFDERKMLFDRHFTIVDEAIKTGNNQLLAIELQQINELANSSPFKALSDMKSLQDTLSKPGSIIDI